MNSAKRLSNQTVKKDPKKTQVKSEGIGKSKIILFGSIGVILIIVLIAVCWEKLHPKLIMKVNSDRLYLSDVMPDIYMTESTGAYMDQLYRQNYGSSYWDAEGQDGMTNAEILKDNCLESIEQKAMILNEANNAGYTLTDEEISQAEESANSAFEQLSAKVKNKTGLTKDSLLQYYKDSTLANKYKQAIIDGFNIDPAAVTANISKDDYRGYSIQYYYIPYSTTDEAGQSVDMTDADKAAAKKELGDAMSDLKSLEDFSTYVDSGDAASEGSEDSAADKGPKAPEGTNIKYSSSTFIETDEVPTFDADLLAQIKAMDKDEISDVVEDTKGCYIIKMVDNNSTERYDSECQTAITNEENKQFQAYMDNLEVENYTIEINDDEWDKLEFGKVTTETESE